MRYRGPACTLLALRALWNQGAKKLRGFRAARAHVRPKELRFSQVGRNFPGTRLRRGEEYRWRSELYLPVLLTKNRTVK